MARFKTGQVAITAAAQALATDTNEYTTYVVKASSLNTGNAALGDSTVAAATGLLLEPGESFTYGVDNEPGEPVFDIKLQDLFVVGTLGDTVSWLAHKV